MKPITRTEKDQIRRQWHWCRLEFRRDGAVYAKPFGRPSDPWAPLYSPEKLAEVIQFNLNYVAKRGKK